MQLSPFIHLLATLYVSPAEKALSCATVAMVNASVWLCVWMVDADADVVTCLSHQATGHGVVVNIEVIIEATPQLKMHRGRERDLNEVSSSIIHSCSNEPPTKVLFGREPTSQVSHVFASWRVSLARTKLTLFLILCSSRHLSGLKCAICNHCPCVSVFISFTFYSTSSPSHGQEIEDLCASTATRTTFVRITFSHHPR